MRVCVCIGLPFFGIGKVYIVYFYLFAGLPCIKKTGVRRCNFNEPS